MNLFLTQNDFVWKGVARPGIPFLCNREMELVQPPNRYLRYVATIRGRTSSKNTWITYGHHLYEFFAFLEDNAFSWERVNETHLAAWRDAMLARGCARSTVNQRLRCIQNFYQWAMYNGMVSHVPFSVQNIWVSRSEHFMAHIDVSGNRFDASQLTIQTFSPNPQFLHLNKAIQFLEALSPHRLKLMGYLALLTGMRREEVVGLDYRVVPNPAGQDSGKQLQMKLDAAITPTKGSKTRVVMLPYDLAVALWDYFWHDWPKLNMLHKKKFGRESTRFFLSQRGEELSLKGFNNAFAKASTKTEIFCHPHMLRHTFGSYELLRMIRLNGERKALFWVRDRMGHSSITTTEKYIHAVDLIQNDDVDGYQADICDAIRRGH